MQKAAAQTHTLHNRSHSQLNPSGAKQVGSGGYIGDQFAYQNTYTNIFNKGKQNPLPVQSMMTAKLLMKYKGGKVKE